MQPKQADYFVVYSRALLESDLPAEAKLLLPFIGNLERMQGCFATNTTLMRIISRSDRKLTMALQDMKERGLITTNGGRGKREIKLTSKAWKLVEFVRATDPIPAPAPVASEEPRPEPKPEPKPKADYYWQS